VYQGDELWTLTLVDPDNRQPVDWELRRRLLAELQAGAAPARETQKLYVLARGLDLRRRRAAAFAGAYFPLEAGSDAVAFLRGEDVLAVVPVRERGLDARVQLPARATGTWRDILTDAAHQLQDEASVAELAGGWGVALLERA
jgi:(1->4)-alpha-D-glucan 1-alpha-D-glucosylmutase